MDNRNFRPPFGFPGGFFDGLDGRGGNRFEDDGDDAFEDDIFGRFRFGNFGRSSPFHDMQNAFSGAEMMFRHMDRMFQDMHMFGDFGQIMGPNDANETLAIESGNRADKGNRRPGRTRSTRDEMLKEPDSDDTTAAFPGGMEDMEVKDHEVKDIITRRGGRNNSQGGFSWSGSSSMTSFSGLGDGKMEERRTVQNPDGSKSTIATRRMGGREITITKTINRNGEEEVEEELVNMDEDDRENFEREWTGHGGYQPLPGSRPSPDSSHPRDQRSIMSSDEPPLLDRHGPGILSKIFGNWFR